MISAKDRAVDVFWWSLVIIMSLSAVVISCMAIGMGISLIAGAAKWLANTHMGLSW